MKFKINGKIKYPEHPAYEDGELYIIDNLPAIFDESNDWFVFLHKPSSISPISVNDLGSCDILKPKSYKLEIEV